MPKDDLRDRAFAMPKGDRRDRAIERIASAVVQCTDGFTREVPIEVLAQAIAEAVFIYMTGPAALRGRAATLRARKAQAESLRVRREDKRRTEAAIVSDARSLLESGRDRRDIAPILEGRKKIPARRIRIILKKHGI